MKVPLLTQLIRVARQVREDARVPYAFEKRIMERIRSMPPLDNWTGWAPVMWRAAYAGLFILVLTSAVVYYTDQSQELLATDLERTVLASVDVDDTW